VRNPKIEWAHSVPAAGHTPRSRIDAIDERRFRLFRLGDELPIVRLMRRSKEREMIGRRVTALSIHTIELSADFDPRSSRTW
jgi:hypothetical protein